MGSEICDGSIHLCRVRFTRLTDLGYPAAGPNNVYVTDNPITLTWRPQVEAGQDRVVTGGCDCIVLSYRGKDKLKRFDVEVDFAKLEPALLEMILGASAFSEGGKVAGWWWPDQLSCSAAQQPNICMEAWSDAWTEDRQESAPIQYIHWIWPSVHFQISDGVLQNDFLMPRVTGYTRSNPNWGLGIFGDTPQAVQPLGGAWFTNTMPTAICDYQSQPIT